MSGGAGKRGNRDHSSFQNNAQINLPEAGIRDVWYTM